MEQRLSLVTLGTRDLKKATAFYQAIGFTPHPRSSEDITFFQMNGMVFGLYSLEALAEEAAGGQIGSGFGGMTISYNTRTREEVDTFVAEAVKAGGSLVRKPQDVFWGGYSGYFADPDGYRWEVAFNDQWDIDEAGHLSLGD
jgi:hypothetical protein